MMWQFHVVLREVLGLRRRLACIVGFGWKNSPLHAAVLWSFVKFASFPPIRPCKIAAQLRFFGELWQGETSPTTWGLSLRSCLLHAAVCQAVQFQWSGTDTRSLL